MPPCAISAFNYITELQDSGVPYPVWGTCLGFQWLTELIANDTTVLSCGFDAEDLLLPLEDVKADSRMFGSGDVPDYMSIDRPKLFEDHDVTMNMHTCGIHPQTAANMPDTTSSPRT